MWLFFRGGKPYNLCQSLLLSTIVLNDKHLNKKNQVSIASINSNKTLPLHPFVIKIISYCIHSNFRMTTYTKILKTVGYFRK